MAARIVFSVFVVLWVAIMLVAGWGDDEATFEGALLLMRVGVSAVLSGFIVGVGTAAFYNRFMLAVCLGLPPSILISAVFFYLDLLTSFVSASSSPIKAACNALALPAFTLIFIGICGFVGQVYRSYLGHKEITEDDDVLLAELADSQPTPIDQDRKIER